jgi:predicted metal-binding membrane protein
VTPRPSADANGAPLSRRARIAIVGCIAVAGALAWGYLVDVGRTMTSAADHDAAMRAMGMSMDMPGTTAFGFLFVMWSVMMVAMMAGPAIPTVLLFAAARERNRRARAGEVPLFAIGYALVWIAFGAAAALAQWGLHEAAPLSPAMALENPRAAGLVLAAVGLYQLAPLKRACLARCRSPLGFLVMHWRDGRAGALRMGVRYGVYCVGCCAALMAVLFAVGVMSLAWVAALTLLVLIEKVRPAGAALARVAGVAAIAAGALLAAGVL